MFLIRQENLSDHAAVREVNLQAFNGDSEAQLVDRLRSDGAVVTSLVALEGGEIVGHILFSNLSIEAEPPVLDAVSLAPMAVVPKCQHRGIGSALVQKGLELCRQSGKTIVVVLGHPDYYPRFGFSAELAKRLHGPYSGNAWMAVELVSGALDGVEGIVRYPDAFGLVS
jgi:putative acetyltransferase